MKKHFIVGLLFLNITCAMHADTPVPPQDAFVTELNYNPGTEYVPVEKTGFNALLHSAAEHMPEAVMLAIVVALCNCDEFKQWVREKYQLTRQKLSNLKQYVLLKINRKSSVRLVTPVIQSEA